ncbi:MAG: thiol reductase thioredoxin [Thermoplasmata archaeon]|nr:thioredoxin family protein [Thermoplasmata archaeon]NIT78297.1 thioredoxin family protein [Thermoplasmata archaeon]NIU49933.1 thioredoxin family protein [Thermoplasmata archaeon]NIV79629.1 thiol reductase thioredoxin [Thermoplasmata archaeon]NIW83444.1 thiol reductase thioredoxin [Thermoplasmata archaeon]
MDLEFVGDSDWEESVLGAEGAVLVEFWSPTCAVCRVMEPRLQRVVEDLADRAAFFRVDVTEEEDLLWAYEVMSTPTFIAFRDTEPVGALYGEVDVTELENLLLDAIEGQR